MNVRYVNGDDENEKEKNQTENPTSEGDITPPRKNNKIGLIIALIIITLSVSGYFTYKHYTTPALEIVTEDTCITKSNAELYDYYKNSVVMIKNRFGIKVTITDQEPIILENYYIQNFEFFASGFFVDESGRIITNRHVLIPPNPYPENIDNELKNLKIKIVSNLPKDTDPIEYKNKLYQIVQNGSIYEEEEQVHTENELMDSIDLDNIEPTVVEYFENHEIQVEPVSLEIKVMSHDTDEWLSAKILKTSDDNNIDIGVIQLESETTPSNVTNVVKIENFMLEDSAIKPGTKAIMIGFPMGMNLANTNSGIIKAQMYEGDINKESDGIKFQYSIPSSQGASGAPVFNTCGQLIAVNFSGYDQQGFNFGIVSKHAYNLISEYHVATEVIDSTAEATTEVAQPAK